MKALPDRLQRFVKRIEGAEALDQIGEPLGEAVGKALSSDRRLKDVLSGTWLGHPLHPLLTDIPIGCFTSVTILDVLGGRRAKPAADALLALGLVSAVPTAAAGASDWSETKGADRRVGVVHMAANTVGLGFYAWSFAARRRDERVRGAVLALLGMGAMTVGGYLGGHLVFGGGADGDTTVDVREQDVTDEARPLVSTQRRT